MRQVRQTPWYFPHNLYIKKIDIKHKKQTIHNVYNAHRFYKKTKQNIYLLEARELAHIYPQFSAPIHSTHHLTVPW